MTVLHKLNIINDHIAEEKEDFDLNFFPTGIERVDTKASINTSPTLSRVNTRTSIVDSIWSRKQSQAPAQLDIGSGLSRVSTWRSERADSVVGGATIEEEGNDFFPFIHLTAMLT